MRGTELTGRVVGIVAGLALVTGAAVLLGVPGTPTPAAAGGPAIPLPYSDSVNSSKAAFEITNKGKGQGILGVSSLGIGGDFVSGWLEAATDNTQPALRARHIGKGPAGYFETSSKENNNSTLLVVNKSMHWGGASAIEAQAGAYYASAGLFKYDLPTGEGHGVLIVSNGKNYNYWKDDGAALSVLSNGDSWAGYFEGTGKGRGVFITAAGGPGLVVQGATKSALVPTAHGHRLLYTEESSEVWFVDYGHGRLKGGHATIPIESVFAETVNLSEPYHVFAQVNDAESNGVAVVNKSKTGFEVVELQKGKSNAEFSYRLVGKRRGFESKRLEEFADKKKK